MTHLVLVVSVLAVVMAWSSLAYAVEPPKSPEVHPDHRVTFRLLAPRASEVVLFSKMFAREWPLRREADGIWSVTLGPLDPDIYTYNFRADGLTVSDPQNPDIKFWQVMSSQVEVPGDTPLPYEAQDVPHGALHMHEYKSKSLEKTRRLVVYTPPGYEKSAPKKYPVLFLLHGWGDTEITWTSVGRAHRIAENLQAANKARPMIIVMPYGHADFPDSPLPPPGRLPNNIDAFTADLFNEVLPFIDRLYRVYDSPQHRAIAGLSMGGSQSLIIGLNHPEIFGWVAGFSAAIPKTTFDDDFPDLAENPKQETKNLKLLWVGCGRQDELFTGNEQFHAWLDKKHVRHIYRPTEGIHEWPVWRAYLTEVMPMLFADEKRK